MVKSGVDTALGQLGLMIVMGTDPETDEGTCVARDELEKMDTSPDATGWVPNRMLVVPSRLLPLMVTTVPACPVVGVNDVIVGFPPVRMVTGIGSEGHVSPPTDAASDHHERA